MLAIWLVGFEEASPEDSGEICIAELYGDRSGRRRSTVRLGVKSHHDPRLRPEMVDLPVDLDTTDEHTYAAEWDHRGVRLYIDGRLVRTVAQTLDYPLQLMIDLFEFPSGDARDDEAYPKSAYVHRVRGYEPV
jgi:beta-glucanase (GH16 family)